MEKAKTKQGHLGEETLIQLWKAEEWYQIGGGSQLRTNSMKDLNELDGHAATSKSPIPPLSALPSLTEPKLITFDAICEGAGEVTSTLSAALMNARTLIELPIEPRPKVLGEWFREGDFGYIFAPRGHGKTWMAMLVGNAICEAASLGKWEAGAEPRRVVYFDAEMNLPDVQERARLVGITSPRFEWLQNELIFNVLETSLNIADPDDQEAISGVLNSGDVLIIDNLSTAISGSKENDNDDFDYLKSWLLRLRNRRVSVIIIHHAGRNGAMRGASRREDMAHWIISLKDDSDDEGATAFVTQFVKCRNCTISSAPPLRWTITTKGGRLTYTCDKHNGPDAMLAMIRSGVGSATDLAKDLGVSPGCVSKWAKRLIMEGLIQKKGRDYVSVEASTTESK